MGNRSFSLFRNFVALTLILAGFVFALVGGVMYAGKLLTGDASEMAYIRGKRDIYIVDVSRAFTYQLARTDIDINFPRWSPDGRQLVFTAIKANGDTGVIRVDRQGHISEIFTRAVPIWSTDWSPDNDEVALIADDQILLMKADGSRLRNLRNLVRTYSYSLAWSPDGELLAYIAKGDANSPYLYLLDAAPQDHADAIRLLDMPVSELARPSWSPDSGRLAFISGSQLYVAAAASGEARRVSDATVIRASGWSPDSESLAFVSLPFLYIANANGETRRIPVTISVESRPIWSPDGEWLAFVSGSDLYAVSPDGRRLRLITTDGGNQSITEYVWRR
jgi:Tol biopolymer transport system component